MTQSRTRPRSAEAPPTEHVEGGVSGDALIECDHLDGDASLIRSMGEDFPGYWSCSRCGTPFVYGSIAALALVVVTLYGEWVRGRATLAPDLQAAVGHLASALPSGTPVAD
jgi:hypothetical protein